MTLLKQKIRQTTAATWAADSTISVDVESIGVITRLSFQVEVTPSATLTGANQPDSLTRLVQNIRVEGSSQVYCTLPAEDGAHAGTLLHYLNRKDGFGIGHMSGSVTVPVGQAHIPIVFRLHPGSRPRDAYGRDNPFDLTAAIPAGIESQLTLEWVTSGNDVMDDTVTISSAVGRVLIDRITADSPGELLSEMQAQGVPGARTNHMVTPQWSAAVKSIGSTAADFVTITDDLPTGAWLKRVGLLAQDATATRPIRAADEITRIQLKDNRRGVPLHEWHTDDLSADMPMATMTEADDAAGDFQGSAPQGVWGLDMRPLAHPEYGLNLQGVQNGDFQLAYIVTNQASGDDRLLLFERLLPVQVDFNEVRK